MNETLQQFCQRILPVVQAGAEGKEIEAKAEMTGWEVKTFPSFSHSREYRIAQQKATPLPITPEVWAMIDPKYEWAVLNENGEMKLTSNKPKWWSSYLGTGWHVDIYNEIAQLPLAIDTTGIIPEMSLTKRPAVVDDQRDCECVMASILAAEQAIVRSFRLVKQDHPFDLYAATPRQAGEIKGGAYDPESTIKEMDRLAEEHYQASKKSATHKIGSVLYKEIAGEWFFGLKM